MAHERDLMQRGIRSEISSLALVAYSLGCFFFLYAFVQRVSPSIMTAELMRDFAAGGAALGVLSGMYFYSYACMQLPVGMLMDRFGPRKLMSLAALLCALASLWFAWSDSLLTASLSRSIIGASVAFAFVGTLTICSIFFPARVFATAAGILMAVGMFGAIVGQAPLRLLLEQMGWRNLYLVLAAVALLLSLLLFVLVPRRPAPAHASVQHPAAGSPAGQSGWYSGLAAVLFNRQSWLCAGAGFGLSATMLSLSGLWAVPWLTTTRGLNSAAAATTASFMFAGFALGSASAGWLSGVFKTRKNVLIGGSLLALATLLVMLYGDIQNQSTLSLLFLLNGMACGTMSLCFVLVRVHTPAHHTATALGLINMCVVGSGALLQPLIGWLLDLNWQGELTDGARVYGGPAYSISLSTLVVATLFALLCTVLVRENPTQSQEISIS